MRRPRPYRMRRAAPARARRRARRTVARRLDGSRGCSWAVARHVEAVDDGDTRMERRRVRRMLRVEKDRRATWVHLGKEVAVCGLVVKGGQDGADTLEQGQDLTLEVDV